GLACPPRRARRHRRGLRRHAGAAGRVAGQAGLAMIRAACRRARAAAFLAVALAMVSSAPARANWTASGQFLYRDRQQDLNGFTGVEPDLPTRHVDVQIVDTVANTVLASGATDANGFYSIAVTDAQTRTV